MSDEARTAQVAAWGLLLTSAVALGATIAAINNHAWGHAAGMLTVTLLTAWASAAERQNQREAQRDAL